MPLCPHGINQQNKRCYHCEDVAEAENKVYEKVESRRNGRAQQEEEDFDYFDINLLDLEQEWARQTRVFRTHSRKLAKAREQWERAKAAKEVMKAEKDKVEAQLELGIRRDAKRWINGKPLTEKAVEKSVLLCKKFQEAQQLFFDAETAIIDAHYAMNMLEADVKTLEQKKTALENITKLALNDLHAEPRLPKGDNDKMRERLRDKAFASKGQKKGNL